MYTSLVSDMGVIICSINDPMSNPTTTSFKRDWAYKSLSQLNMLSKLYFLATWTIFQTVLDFTMMLAS